ncbi:DinB family protein [Neobacillus vireti]|uniref:DinB family protein n=1 Tax=Neobacillus vireti LMG 21834 TaxID=1131730 RepID=A0AB94IN56_9BACI|nr:DinB family protein [Neobacillus vireti]ETI68470.1 DinB family protein [Neobacillus vireti LMG 21834]
MKQDSLRLYDYHVWANKRVFNHLKDLPNEVYRQEIKSVFSSIEQVVIHLFKTDVVWLCAMSDKNYEEIQQFVGKYSSEIENKTLEEMESKYLKFSEQYINFLSSQEDLDAKKTLKHPMYGQLETRISELVQHVVNHGTYHRGNITAMLRQLGYPGPSTDYIFYLYEKKGN